MSIRPAFVAMLMCLILSFLFIGKVNAQDCEEACPPVCKSGNCPENIVAHLGKYNMQSLGWVKTPTHTPTITSTPKPTLTPTITTIPGLIIYFNTTPVPPIAPVLEATTTPLPTVETVAPQATPSPQVIATLTGTESAALVGDQAASAALGKSSIITPTPKAAKNFYEVGGVTIQQWTLVVREWIRNPVWVTVLAIILAILLIRTIGWLVIGLITWSRSVRGVIGPIQVEDIKDNPGLASQFYKYLAECGASFQSSAITASPSATPGFTSITAALVEVAPVESKIISIILSVFYFLIGISSYRNLGYSVTAHINGEDEKKNINLQVIVTQINGQKFKTSRRFEGSSTEVVVKEAAYWVFWYVSGRRKSRAHLAPWLAFPTFESFYNYKQALCEPVLEKANALFTGASTEAPFNALINLSWGDKNELNNHYIDALKRNLEGIMMWPHLLSFWYRFAVILDCYRKWIPQPDEDSKKKEAFKNDLSIYAKKLVEGELKEIIGEYVFTIKNDQGSLKDFQECIKTFDFTNIKFILLLANIVWLYIEKLINSSFSLWVNQVCTNIFTPWRTVDNSPAKARYFWTIIPFFHLGARQTRKSVHLAHYCTKVEQIKNGPLLESIYFLDDRVKQIINSWCNDVGVYYDVACYYSLRSEILFEPYSLDYCDLYTKYPPKNIVDAKYFDAIKQIQRNPVFSSFYRIIAQENGKEKPFVFDQAPKGNENYSVNELSLMILAKSITDVWTDEEILIALKAVNEQDSNEIRKYFTQLILNESVRDYCIKKAIKYLIISFKEPQPYLTLDWVRNDPDLDPLWGEIDFQVLFDIPPEKTHKDFKKDDCKKKIEGLKAADSICKALAKKDLYSHSHITPELLITISKNEIELWEGLSAYLKTPDKESLRKKIQDLFNQLQEHKISELKSSNPPEHAKQTTDQKNEKEEKAVDYFSIFELINQNCDQFATHALAHAEDWKDKLETSKLFITSERVANLEDIWMIWERARMRQWDSIDKEIVDFINSDALKVFKDSRPLLGRLFP
ncbi:MAG: hypothetical protein C0410_01110 [Anaerolinea sp.]|nr:hypothetical protein [Anaerolinea sp.]